MISRLISLVSYHISYRFEKTISSIMKSVLQELGRRALLIASVTFILSSLLTAGLIITAIELALQYDRNLLMTLTGMLFTGLLLSVFSIIFLALIFWPRNRTVSTDIKIRPSLIIN